MRLAGHRWGTSDRRSRLPPDWKTRRARVWLRDHGRCQWPTGDGGRCLKVARDVDHIADPDDHTDANLRCLCGPHHTAKTQAEALAGRVHLFREPERHPGLTD